MTDNLLYYGDNLEILRRYIDRVHKVHHCIT